MGKKLRVREPTCHKNQNGLPRKKRCVMENFVTDYTCVWPILKPIEGPENIMLEVEVKPLDGRNRVPSTRRYILKLSVSASKM